MPRLAPPPQGAHECGYMAIVHMGNNSFIVLQKVNNSTLGQKGYYFYSQKNDQVT